MFICDIYVGNFRQRYQMKKSKVASFTSPNTENYHKPWRDVDGNAWWPRTVIAPPS